MLAALDGKFPREMEDQISLALLALQDPLQSALDRANLADSRHILAVRT